jgi:hypothetical protein
MNRQSLLSIYTLVNKPSSSLSFYLLEKLLCVVMMKKKLLKNTGVSLKSYLSLCIMDKINIQPYGRAR